MQILIKLPLFFFLTCLFLCFTAQAYAVPTFTISSSDNGIFVLQGTGLQVIGGAKIIIRYDTSTLTNPRVTQGGLASGAIFLPNTATQGIIRMGLVAMNGISGSGSVASIAFDRVGSSPGVIQKLDAEVIDLNGKPVAALVRVINPAELPPSSLTEAASAAAATASAASSASPGQSTASTGSPQLQPQTRTGTVGGLPIQQIDGITAPPSGSDRTGETTPAEQPDVATASLPVPARISTPTNLPLEAPEGKPVEKIQPAHVAYKSVLEQFRAVAGLKKSPQELTGIFTRHTMPGIRQEPAVALSDGTSKLRLSITLNSPATKAPNFSLKNATLISLRIEDDSSWLIEVLPAKGVCSATLTMLLSDRETEIPLLVSSPLPGGGIAGIGRDGKLNDADFARFLTDRGTDKAPRFDLNGDGKRDYIDDYIFTANYLIGEGM